MKELFQFAETLGFKLYSFQEELLTNLLVKPKNVILAARQSGISTMLIIFVTYKLINSKLANKPFNVGLISFKTMNALYFITKVHHFLEKLHIAHITTRTQISVINGGTIFLLKKSDINDEDKIKSLNLVSVDDYSFFDDANTAFVNNILNTVAKDTSIILASTGGGKNVNNLIELKNDSTYTFSTITWNQIARDEKWVAKMKEMMGEENFHKEFEIDKIIEEYETNKRKNSKN